MVRRSAPIPAAMRASPSATASASTAASGEDRQQLLHRSVAAGDARPPAGPPSSVSASERKKPGGVLATRRRSPPGATGRRFSPVADGPGCGEGVARRGQVVGAVDHDTGEHPDRRRAHRDHLGREVDDRPRAGIVGDPHVGASRAVQPPADVGDVGVGVEHHHRPVAARVHRADVHRQVTAAQVVPARCVERVVVGRDHGAVGRGREAIHGDQPAPDTAVRRARAVHRDERVAPHVRVRGRQRSTRSRLDQCVEFLPSRAP